MLSQFDFSLDLYYTKKLDQETYGGIVCGKLILAKLGRLPHNNSCPKARVQGANKGLASPNGDRMELAMSNAQNYNKALNLAAQSHTDKYNATKARVLATGVELSDDAFDALYRAAVGTSGLICTAPTEISDAHADALDLLVAFLNANRDEWFTFSDLCGRSGAIKTSKTRDWNGNTYTTLDNKNTRDILKEFFDRLIKAKVFEVDTMVFKSNGTNVLYVYKAR